MLADIKEVILPVVQEMALEIYDIEYVKVENDYYLRIYLDRPTGIDLDLIVEASRVISDLLDDLDPIDNEYILEVSSAGAERELKTNEHFKKALNEYIRVEMKDPKAGRDFVEGYLLAFENDILTIKYQDKTRRKMLEISYDNIKKARLAIKF